MNGTREPKRSGLREALVIARRDLLEFIRDRRTMFITLLLPMATYPCLALSTALGLRTASTEIERQRAPTRISVVVSGADAPALAARVLDVAKRPPGSTRADWPAAVVIDSLAADDARARLAAGACDLWIEADSDAAERLDEQGTVMLPVHMPPGRPPSQRVREQFEAVMRAVADDARARRVARAARRAGARLVHVSSVDAIGLRADGQPADEDTPPGGMLECPYVVTKRDAEAAVLDEVERGLDAVIVNPVYMIGPWDWKPSSGRMLLEVGAGKGLFAPPGANDFVDVRDVVGGLLAALDRGHTGRRYILGGHRLSYLDAWRVFARVTGRMQPLGTAPAAIARTAGWIGDLAGLLRRREPAVNSAAVGMSMLAHNFSCRRAETELGYHYRAFNVTVEDAWNWFIERGYARAIGGRTVLAR